MKVLLVGCGQMGVSHARGYLGMKDVEIVGIVSRTKATRTQCQQALGTQFPEYEDVAQALKECQPDAVCISTYPDTHAEFAKMAMEAGAHVFLEKPIATTVADAEEVVAVAEKTGKKLVVGYILRHHPSWQQFIKAAQTLGKPLVMRMNLNQQSSGDQWLVHRNLMRSISPIVDCGVHYVDVMCQMTRSVPVSVSAIGVRLTDEVQEGMYNYGQLQVRFQDGSVGWYEAGWGPMMSEVAFFVKDVVGPEGSVSLVAGKQGNSNVIEDHTKTGAIQRHFSKLNEQGEFAQQDEITDTADEPDHDALCAREQEYFVRAIRENLDLSDHWTDAVNSLRIVLAADESVRTGQTVKL